MKSRAWIYSALITLSSRVSTRFVLEVGRKSKFFRFTRDTKNALISFSSSYTFLVLMCNIFCMRFYLRYSWIIYFKFHITCFIESIRMLCRLNPPVIFFPLLLVFTFVLNFIHFAEKNNNKNQVIKLSR